MSVWPATAAVVGAGTMGRAFVQLLALAGVEVRVADVSEDAARAACGRAVEEAARFAEAGLMPDDAAALVASHVGPAASLRVAAAGAELVLEAVAEDPRVKAAVYAEVEAAAPADAVLATNTSAIPISVLAGGLSRAERFLGTHWFNPAQWIPCVEVIRGPETTDDVVDRVLALLQRLGKRPTLVGDSAGFVANRIQFAMFKEAAAVVAEGVATAEQVDEVVAASFGFRLPLYGPFQIADMAGLDVYAGAYAALADAFGPRFEPPASLVEQVEAGRLGLKSGAGYLPAAHDVDGLTARRDAAYVALARFLAEHSP